MAHETNQVALRMLAPFLKCVECRAGKEAGSRCKKTLPAHFVMPTAYADAALGLFVSRASSAIEGRNQQLLKKKYTHARELRKVAEIRQLNCAIGNPLWLVKHS